MSEAVAGQPDGEVRRYFWRNYVAHAFDGGFFTGGLAFVDARTVLPTMVLSLGGPAWLISLMPVMFLVGAAIPPIFTAHLIDRLTRFHPILMTTGIFQRLPYLAAGIVLLAAAEGSKGVMLAAVALAPLVCGMACGSTVTGWLQLVMGTIPEGRRSSVMALRLALSGVIGLGAGWVVKAVLSAWPEATGYAILHFAAFGSLGLSYIAFGLLRETSTHRPVVRPHGLRENLRAIPNLLRSAGNLRVYLVACALLNGIYIVVPFLAIHAQHVLNKPESYAGDLLIVQMAGIIAGNLAAALLGDRFGGKTVVVVAQTVFIVLVGWSIFAESDWALRTIFFLFGFAFTAGQVGTFTITMDICPAERRATHLAIISVVN
ncbi:MAG: MFS transporter, partial [Planctomycetota bacterium]|nr:MFS transporter [Planctomycetota bacterium]